MQDRGAHAAGHLLGIHIQWMTDVGGDFLTVVQTLGGAYTLANDPSLVHV